MAPRTSGVLLARCPTLSARRASSAFWPSTTTRENPGLIADTSLSGARVARELTALIRITANPTVLSASRHVAPLVRATMAAAPPSPAPCSPAPRSSNALTAIEGNRPPGNRRAIPAWPGVAWHDIDPGQSSGKQSPGLSSDPPHTQQNPRPLTRTNGVRGLPPCQQE